MEKLQENNERQRCWDFQCMHFTSAIGFTSYISLSLAGRHAIITELAALMPWEVTAEILIHLELNNSSFKLD